MKQVLVTGGAGFIGCNLVKALLLRDEQVVVLDNFSSGKRENLNFVNELASKGNFKLIEGDICDYQTCLKATKEVEVVFHQAALKSVPESIEKPKIYNQVNVGGTLNLLKACSQNRVEKFIFASSSSVYGDAEKFPQTEDSEPNPLSPYAFTKLAGEFYLNLYCRYSDIKGVSLRYFNVYGPYQALDDQYAVVIPKFINSILADQQPPIFGDGNQSRDFVYIGDVVRANLLAAAKSDLAGQVLNIASGVEIKVIDIAHVVANQLNKKAEPQYLPPRSGDAYKTLADISRAGTFLDYKPEVDFNSGIAKTIDFFRQKK
jgi:nucleoside-diphosphate-sugar epimerase